MILNIWDSGHGASIFPGHAWVLGPRCASMVLSMRTPFSRTRRCPDCLGGRGESGPDPAALRSRGIWDIQRTLDFVQTVYGVERGAPQDQMDRITAVYAELFGLHRDDRPVE